MHEKEKRIAAADEVKRQRADAEKKNAALARQEAEQQRRLAAELAAVQMQEQELRDALAGQQRSHRVKRRVITKDIYREASLSEPESQ